MCESDALRVLRAGEFLFRQGDPTTALYMIERGRMRLERCTWDGRHVTLHTARAGETFAEAALFASHYHCDVVALDDGTRVRLRPKNRVLDALGGNDDPAGIAGLLEAMARQIHGLRRRLELRNVRSARDRVLLALDLHPANVQGTVTLDAPIQDFAADIGLTREALYRTLAALHVAGRIRREGSCITLVKLPGT